MSVDRPSRRTVLTLFAVTAVSAVLNVVFGAVRVVRTDGGAGFQTTGTVSLPDPQTTGDVPIERVIADRRSRREYTDAAIDRAALAQLLWATQGVTERPSGHRAAPSAGALYPLEVYAVVGSPGVEGVDSGVYRYRPGRHDLARGEAGDVQSELAAAAVDQAFVAEAPVDVVVSAVDDRTTVKYGDRGARRYVPMEAGHAVQNLYLQAEALGLATVSLGAFSDDGVRDALGLPETQRPLYVCPVGGRA